jgi:hypothetical protein
MVNIDVSSNALAGFLPSTWGAMRMLRVSASGSDSTSTSRAAPPTGISTALHPQLRSTHASWERPCRLGKLAVAIAPRPSHPMPPCPQVLDLRSNCGLCGGFPPLLNNVTIFFSGTNLDTTCNAFNCAVPFFGNLLLAVGIVMAALLLCMVQQQVRLQRAEALLRPAASSARHAQRTRTAPHHTSAC